MQKALELQRRDRKILRAAKKARSLAEVGRQFGLTRARVAQIVREANGSA